MLLPLLGVLVLLLGVLVSLLGVLALVLRALVLGVLVLLLRYWCHYSGCWHFGVLLLPPLPAPAPRTQVIHNLLVQHTLYHL